MHRFSNLINGEERAAASGATLEVFDPAVGRTYATCPDSGADDVDEAVRAAKRAFPAWSRRPAAERAAALSALADLIDSHLEQLARAESVDTGKPISLARNLDIPRASANFRFFAGAILHQRDEAFLTDHRAVNYVQRPPIGVAACISPWNLPLYLFSWKVAPALAAGCTVVGKPSEVTPATASMVAVLAAKAGFPPGVFNVIHGRGAGVGAALVEHPSVAAVSFTGGTATGAAISRSAAPRFKRLSLELGGKNPTIVFADADFDRAVAGAVRSAFLNQGQICLCGSRVLVERSVVDRFREAFVAKARELVPGDPLLDATEQGAIVSREHLTKIEAAVEAAKREGARILCGGGRPQKLPSRCAHGWFHEPTVIEGLPPSAAANQEEIFGPVASLLPFESEEEAISIANGVRYGLAASVWSEDLGRAHRVASSLEAGTVWVNCWLLRDLRTPFGGWKESGVGREGGDEALRFFTEARTVCVATQ